MHKLSKYIISTLFLSMLALAVKAKAEGQSFRLDGNVIIYTSAKPGESLFKAITVLQRDISKVLGGNSIVEDLSKVNKPGIVVINSERDKLIKPLSGWEAHHLFIEPIKSNQQIVLQGADLLGTIYAIYTFSKKILKVPPLWFYSGWKPHKRKEIIISDTFNIRCNSPYVKYRGWFPNDMDLLTPWRKLSKQNNEAWLEAALRLKLNVIDIESNGIDLSKKYAVSPTIRLINSYGLMVTTSHPSPLNANFNEWVDYWREIKHIKVPDLLLSNEEKIIDFWRYNIECIEKNNVKMLWEISFRGAGDHPFWYTFKDAPKNMKERADVINRMMKIQRNLLIDITHNPEVETNTIFYNEMSDLLAEGYIHPPSDSNFIWTFVAARRDHYPNADIQGLDTGENRRLGYYLNMQFNSTGSHLVEGEGPWKMERNFRYVDNKSESSLAYSVVNVGNIREFLLSISANAAMMWNFNTYNTDKFLKEYSSLYFGRRYADQIARLYHEYFYSYWQPKKPDLAGFDRQYIFQDLRYKQAIKNIVGIFFDKYDPNPLKDYSDEQVKGRTYRIVPKDNNALDQIDAIINGTTISAGRFLQVARSCDKVYHKLPAERKTFLNDNLRAPAYFMYYLNESLLNLCKAYRLVASDRQKTYFLNKSIEAFKSAEDSLRTTAHGHFLKWYAGDHVFNMNALLHSLSKLQKIQLDRNTFLMKE